MNKRIARPSFSDAAKKKRGVTPYDLAAELKAAKAQMAADQGTYEDALDRFKERVRDAIRAFEESRRGDGMALLRALVKTTDGRLPLPKAESEPPVSA